jgi:hypothetical protein
MQTTRTSASAENTFIVISSLQYVTQKENKEQEKCVTKHICLMPQNAIPNVTQNPSEQPWDGRTQNPGSLSWKLDC